MWAAVRAWANAVPQRNSLLVAGDFNASLRSSPPHVGPGVQSHSTQGHPDQREFQNLVASTGLIAVNTWGRSGPKAATFLMPNGNGVQIDYMLTRLPCSSMSRKAASMHDAQIIHPTGFRHVPVACSIVPPSKPKTRTASTLTAHKVKEVLSQHPEVALEFNSAAAHSLQQRHDRPIDACLADAWGRCVQKLRSAPPSVPSRPEISLKAFWCAKRKLRNCQPSARAYHAPVIWHIARSSSATLGIWMPRTMRNLRSLLPCGGPRLLSRGKIRCCVKGLRNVR